MSTEHPKVFSENQIGTLLLVTTSVQVNNKEKVKTSYLKYFPATAFKIAKSYDQAVQAYAKASEALFKADA